MTNASSSCQTLRRHVCLFGTSANPPTGRGGHVGIVRALADLNAYDEIRVLPVYQHTFSEKRNQLLSFDHRVKMCQLAFGGIPSVVVSRAEYDSWHQQAKAVSDPDDLAKLRVGTADLLEMLQSQEPTSTFSFCLGADTFMDLTSWKWRRAKDVIKLLEGRLVVFMRRQKEVDQEKEQQQQQQQQQQEQQCERQAQERKDLTSSSNNDQIENREAASSKAAVEDRIRQVQSEMSDIFLTEDNQHHHDRTRIRLMEVASLQAISSSMIRSAKDIHDVQELLMPQVVDYILNEQLYGFGAAPPGR